ncbi:MAG: lipocalin-like domain-containing protein [Candidatus Azobacteroides sp.]|nr:lipocalin-like domain-containing protein [Candidatus Azobacteroides sp.]
MKKLLLFINILLPVLLVSCGYSMDYYEHHKLDGMWQLKTVQDAEGNVIPVDTVYYSFHREVIFSFTVLENPKQALYPFYGYIDMPSDNKVHVQIDNKFDDNNRIEYFLNLSGWSSTDVVFDIKKYNNSDLVLFDGGNGKTYTLKKF